MTNNIFGEVSRAFSAIDLVLDGKPDVSRLATFSTPLRG